MLDFNPNAMINRIPAQDLQASVLGMFLPSTIQTRSTTSVTRTGDGSLIIVINDADAISSTIGLGSGCRLTLHLFGLLSRGSMTSKIEKSSGWRVPTQKASNRCYGTLLNPTLRLISRWYLLTESLSKTFDEQPPT